MCSSDLTLGLNWGLVAKKAAARKCARHLQSGCLLSVLCAQVRRETLPPTQLGVAYAILKGDLKTPVQVVVIWLRSENATKAAFVIDDLTGKNKTGNKKYILLVRLRSSQERLGPFPFFPARK